MHTRDKGAIGEQIALTYYEDRGWTCLIKNFTMRGGEIDLIVEHATSRRYIEVKVVDRIDDIHGFITQRKLARITKTIRYHMMKHPTNKDIQLDVVLVKGGEVSEVYENVTF